jgi:MarR-like DNA-binding transcriptional regulator SgrR of sgrS sRNA
VTAALAGARVLAVDRSTEAATFAAVNAARNGVTLQTAVSASDQPERLLLEAPWDLVLAADVLYEPRNLPVLAWLLPRLTDATGEVWLADPGRPMLARLLAGSDATGWRRDQVAPNPDTLAIHRLHLVMGTERHVINLPHPWSRVMAGGIRLINCARDRFGWRTA